MESFIAILGVVLISVECEYRLGKFRLSRREQEKEAPVGTMVGATLGLLAFILAFTFGLASSRFDNRRQLLLDEANALGTTYLRAGMLPEWGEEVRRLLRDYIGHRLDAVRSGDVTEGIRRSENIQQQVWTEAETVAQKNLNSIVVGLVLIPEPLVLLRQNYYGRGGGVSFGCFVFPPSGCPCA